MNPWMKALGVGSLAGLFTAALPQQYELQILPNADVGWAINAAGDCTGTHVPPPGTDGRAFIYSDAGGSQDLPPVGAFTDCRGYAINDFDQVAGTANDRPAIWTNGVGQVIPMLPDNNSVRVTGISNSGLVIGYPMGVFGPGPHSGFIWSSSTGVAPLLPLTGSNSSRAYDINNSDVVVGLSFYSNGANKATEWVNGVPSELAPGQNFSEGFANNDLGNVVGTRSDGSAVFWERGHPLTLIGHLPGYSGISPRGLNNSNIAVGNAGNVSPQPTSRGWVWDADHGLQDLNSVTTGMPSGWTITWATGINDNGQIVGIAENSVGLGYAVRLNPVPEPSAVFALGLGVMVLIGMRATRPRQ